MVAIQRKPGGKRYRELTDGLRTDMRSVPEFESGVQASNLQPRCPQCVQTGSDKSSSEATTAASNWSAARVSMGQEPLGAVVVMIGRQRAAGRGRKPMPRWMHRHTAHTVESSVVELPFPLSLSLSLFLGDGQDKENDLLFKAVLEYGWRWRRGCLPSRWVLAYDAMMAVWEGKLFGGNGLDFESCSWAGLS